MANGHRRRAEVDGAPDVAAQPRQRRRRKISDDGLARAVVAVGFTHLTVDAVATELGVASSSLYKHVPDRNALVGFTMDWLVARHRWPEPTDDWRGYLRGTSLAIWYLLEQHPGLALEHAAQLPGSDSLLGLTETLEGHLASLGFVEDDAYLAVDLIIDLPFDVAMRTERYRDDPNPDHLEEATEWFEQKLRIVLDGIGASLAP